MSRFTPEVRSYPTITDWVRAHPFYTQNSHAGPCHRCGTWVPRYQGTVQRLKRNGKTTYRIAHLAVPSECPALQETQ